MPDSDAVLTEKRPPQRFAILEHNVPLSVAEHALVREAKGVSAQIAFVLGLLDAARQRGMRFGYIEFNHAAIKHRNPDGEFFSWDYDSLSLAATSLRCSGWTNYEEPLAEALSEFEQLSVGRSSRAEQHILLITDGVPTHGDPEASRQRAWAQQLGVVVHSVYLGWPQSFPTALETLSVDTRGCRYAAFYQPALTAAPDSLGTPRKPRERGAVGVGLDSGFIRVVER